MEDGDHEGANTSLHGDPRLLVATTLATLAIAGSAYILRSHRVFSGHILGSRRIESFHVEPDSDDTLESKTLDEPRELSVAADPSTLFQTDDSIGAGDVQDSESRDAKNARSKERRRRGKDPLKEILKGGKKLKVPAKLGKAAGETDESSLPSPALLDPTRSQRSRDTSVATSSRSASTSRSSQSRRPAAHQDALSISPIFSNSGHEPNRSGEGVASSSTSSANNSIHLQSDITLPAGEIETTDKGAADPLPASRDSSQLSHTQNLESSTTSLSASSSTSHSSSASISSESIITPSTSPSLSHSTTPTYVQPSQSLSLHSTSSPRLSTTTSPASRTQKVPGPWDWDGATPLLGNDTVSQKPPRFRSRSRGPASPNFSSPNAPLSAPTSTGPQSSRTGASTSYSAVATAGSSRSSSLLSSASAQSTEEVPVPFIFPTLNAAPASSQNQAISHRPNWSGNLNGNGNAAGHSAVNGNGSGNVGNTNTSRRAPTPRRTPTPSSGTNTPPPSLSERTQLASMRGALEAARMREEKMKGDLERYAKEVEMIRWEGVVWRRREVELQSQIHHLMHQLQGYAALFASMSSQTSHDPHRNSNIGSSTSNGAPQPNGFHSPATSPQTSNLHLNMMTPAHILSTNGMTSPAMLSPMNNPNSGPNSPFFGYPPNSHSHHPHGQMPTPPHPQQSHLFSMMFPLHLPASSSGSRPSSVAGSSVGSVSPDMGDSPISGMATLDRGRRRTRTRRQTANEGAGERGAGEGVEGWSLDENDGDDMAEDTKGGANHHDEDDDEDDGGFSEVLADAILKRPGSIRMASKKGKLREQDRSQLERTTEFTFPSLSDLGNVTKENRGKGDSSTTSAEDDNSIMGASESDQTEVGPGSEDDTPKTEDLPTPVPVDAQAGQPVLEDASLAR